jgi:hypothetical protein
MSRGSFLRATKRANSPSGRRYGFESLESRRVMAGNVTAEVINGDLIITGDDAANGITLHALGGGTYQVGSFGFPVGVMLPAFDDTEINGDVPSAPFAGVTGKIILRMRGGDDVVFVGAGFSSPGDVFIDGGSGFDTIRLNEFQAYTTTSTLIHIDRTLAGAIVRSSIGGTLEIESGADGANVSVAYYDIVGDLRITLEPTAAISIGQTNYINVTNVACNALNLFGSAGKDSVVFRGSTENGIRISTEAGNDRVHVYAERVVRDSSINAGEGTDSVYVSGQFGAELIVEGGAGDDSLHLGGEDRPYILQRDGTDPNILLFDDMQRGAGNWLAVVGNLWANSGGGDFVNVQYTSAGWLRINSLNTSTPEFIRLRNVVASAITIDARDGDDVADLTNVRSTQSFTGDMGHGNNSFRASIVAFDGTTTYISTFDRTSLVPVAVFFGGDGTDIFAFEGVRLPGATRMDTGGGDDRLSFVASLVSDPNMEFKTGDGRDRVIMEYCLADSVFLDTGSGDDDVVSRVNVLNKVFFNLGDGNDVLDIFGTILSQGRHSGWRSRI